MSALRPRRAVATSVTPLRRPRPRAPAFVDAPAPERVASALPAAPSEPRPLSDMVVPPTALPQFSAAAARASSGAWSLAPRAAARSLDELLGEPRASPRRAKGEEDAQQEQGMVAFDLKDKMGLFLSVCSVLVSIHMLTPRAM